MYVIHWHISPFIVSFLPSIAFYHCCSYLHHPHPDGADENANIYNAYAFPSSTPLYSVFSCVLRANDNMLNFLLDLLVTMFYYFVWCRGRRLMRRCRIGPLRPRRPPQPPLADCPLFHLPGELILDIADNLPPGSQVFLARSCYRFRTLLGSNSATALQDLSHQPRMDRIAFLALAVQEQADRWCCEVCVALHPACAHDQPGGDDSLEHLLVGDTVYPSRHNHRFFNWWLMNRGCHAPASSRVKHRHVQLALKYTRMQQQGGADRDFCFYHRYYLRRILSPSYPYVYIGFFKFVMSIGAPITVHPKIVDTGADSIHRYRYLLQSVFAHIDTTQFEEDGVHTHYAWLCAHIPTSYSPQTLEQVFPDPNYLCTIKCFWPYLTCHTEKTGESPASIEYHSSCHRCPTDFIWRVHASYVYQDMGTEGAPTDLAWQVHLPGRCAFSEDGVGVMDWNTPTQGPTLHHEPGTVKELYEDADSVGRGISFTVGTKAMAVYILTSWCWFSLLPLFPSWPATNFCLPLLVQIVVHYMLPDYKGQ